MLRIEGVLFVAADRVEDVLAAAQQIWETEREHARKMRQQRPSMNTWRSARRSVAHLPAASSAE
jgi:regulator of RNase E activity RraA